MVPALRSASIAICLPGIASSTNRAATSLILPAPFVITTNWMTTRIRNITIPTTRVPPATKLPNVRMISPALACVRISLVEATFRDNLNRVTKSKSEGKVDSSRGSFVASVMKRTAIASEILPARSTSINWVGSGIRSVVRTVTRPMARIMLLRDATLASTQLSFGAFGPFWPDKSPVFDLAETAIINLLAA